MSKFWKSNLSWDEKKSNEILPRWRPNEKDQIAKRWKRQKSRRLMLILFFFSGNACVFVYCRFMGLKKLVILHLCVLLQDIGIDNFLFVLFMFVSDSEARWDVLVVEFDEGVHDGGNKKDTLLKNKYFFFCK